MIETSPRMSATSIEAPALPWGAEPDKGDVWPSSAQELLLRAALVEDERALEAWGAVRPLIDVASLDGATQALLPKLRKNLLALGVQDELLTLFKGVHRFSWARNQTLLAPMMPIVEALGQAGIATLLMKGAAFVADGRLDAGMRPMNDVDVLVPSAKLAVAIEVLLAGGLEPVGGVPPWYIADYAPRFVPSHGFRDELDRQLDLHWHVLHASCQPDADEAFWAAAQPIELLGVSTRSLCPTDELLLVVLHGLRWNALPTYRWVVDAALLCGGEIGEIDYERLVEQARLRRVTEALGAGLCYLRRVLDVSIPEDCLQALAGHSSRVERFELRAQITQPRRRTALQWQLLYHQQHARREIALGRSGTLSAHLRLERARLGDLRAAFAGGRPGPGRPDSELAAAIGHGDETKPAPVRMGETLDFADPETAHAHAAHGMWRAEGEGSWIAGRQARLIVELAEPPSGSLLLEVSADGFLPEGVQRQRLGVTVNGSHLAELTLRAGEGLREEAVVLPAATLGRNTSLDIVLSAPDAVSQTQLGLADDDRSIGVYLRSLRVRAPGAYRMGRQLSLGAPAREMLAGGWSAEEAEGRWTVGPRARLLLGLEPGVQPRELEFDAIPFLAAGRQTFDVEVLADGRALGTVSYEGAEPAPRASRLALPAGVGDGGEIMLEWRVRAPCSPHALGISPDRRELGIFVRRVELSDRPAGR
ncbi:MAG: nucleotidyltransferase family protein [Solirubrobacteraceae bacterium]